MSTYSDDTTRRIAHRSFSDAFSSQQTVLVTGSTDGIGWKAVRQMLERGIGMVIVHVRNDQRGQPIVNDLHHRYPGTLALTSRWEISLPLPRWLRSQRTSNGSASR